MSFSEEYTYKTREQGVSVENELPCDEMIKLLEDFYNINQIQSSLSTLVHRQRAKLDSIRDNVDSADCNVTEGLTELETAKTYSFRYTPILLGSLFGIALTGPTGLLLGLKMGSLATGLGGGILGGWCGYKIQK